MISFKFNGHADKASGQLKAVPAFLLVLFISTFTTTSQAAELVVNGSFESPDITSFPPGSRAIERGWTTFYGQNYLPEMCSANSWEQECNDDILIPGWSIWWTDSVLMPGTTPGTFVGNPAPDEPGRIEIQNNSLSDRVNPKRASKNIAIQAFNAALPPGETPLPLLPMISKAKDGTHKAEMDSHDRYDPATGELMANHNIAIAQELLTCPGEPYVLTYNWRSRTTTPGDNDVRVVVGDTIVRQHTLTGDWVTETINFVAGSYVVDLAFISVGDGTTKGMSLDGVSVTGPTPDAFGNCPPPCPECTEDLTADTNGDLVHDELDHLDGAISCNCNSDDGSSDDGSSDDGSSADGGSFASGDHGSDDGSSDDGSSDDGSSDDGSSSGGGDGSECGICATGGGFQSMTLLYDGDDYTSHTQDNDASGVWPDPVPGGLPVEAYIKVLDKKGDVLHEGTYFIGQTFEITAPVVGDRVSNTLYVKIYDGSEKVQVVKFHTSCSEELDKMDSFGGITIWDAIKY